MLLIDNVNIDNVNNIDIKNEEPINKYNPRVFKFAIFNIICNSKIL